ncbi:MAG: ABC transporter substrate-binding protein, partial [Cyanobacteria bacterium J06573_11]
MKRRRVLGYGASAAGTSVLAACTQQGGGTASGDLPQVRWRMATSWPQSLDTIYGGAQTVCDRVSELTNGRFTIDPFAAGEIVPGLQVLDAVQEGT